MHATDVSLPLGCLYRLTFDGKGNDEYTVSIWRKLCLIVAMTRI